MLSEARQELRQHFDVNDLNDVNGYIVHAAASGCAHSGNLVNNVGAFDDRAENTVAVAVACLISVEEVIVSNVEQTKNKRSIINFARANESWNNRFSATE